MPERPYQTSGREIRLDMDPTKLGPLEFQLIGRLFAYLDDLVPYEELARPFIDTGKDFIAVWREQDGLTKILQMYPSKKEITLFEPPSVYGTNDVTRREYKELLEKAFPEFKIVE